MIKALVAATGVSAIAIPAIAVVAALGVGASAVACIDVAMSAGPLAADASIPAEARSWVAETKAACPGLPESWIAAVMAQESGFNPNAYADDVNGGTWGLFQLNASVWAAAYGHPWSADLDGDGIWDVRDPDIHARVAGEYLCKRLDGVRALRAQHPDWASSQIPVLGALIIAHNAGESRLRTYPDIPAITARFIQAVDERARLWSTVATLDGPEPPVASGESASAPVPAASRPLRTVGTGCIPGLGADAAKVTVPAGTPNDVATAVTTALSLVGTTGWDGLCDRLACRAYGYASSGYFSAATHWQAMLEEGYAHPGDLCPPLGSFVFFRSGRHVYGHVSVVVQASATCDWSETLVTSNGVFDAAAGLNGGVYLLSLSRLSGMYLGGAGYLGWSSPACQGA